MDFPKDYLERTFLWIRDMYDMMVANLTLQETGGSITTDGTEQNVYINNSPASVFNPRMLKINFDNMVAGDSVTIKVYYILASGGSYLLTSAPITYTGADGGLLGGSVVDEIPLTPDRFGVKVTIQRTMGTDRAYTWEVFEES